MDNRMRIEAAGGLTEVYQAAARRYSYSEDISRDEPPDRMTRLRWLRDAIATGQGLHAWHLHVARKPALALQTRRWLGGLLAEMKKLIDEEKS